MIYDTVLHNDTNAYSDATVVAGTNVIDWQLLGKDVGAQQGWYLNAIVGSTAFAGGTTFRIDLYTHSTSTVASGTKVLQTNEVALADIDAIGDVICSIALPPNVDKARYFGISFASTGTFTAGKATVWISHQPIPKQNTQVLTSNVTLGS